MACIQAPKIIRLTTPAGPFPVSSCHQVYVCLYSLSSTSLIMENCVRTEGELTVAPCPSRAARTSYASSYLPFLMSKRGESGKKGHIKQMRPEKTVDCQLSFSCYPQTFPLTDLKSQGKPPTHTPWRKGESQGQPVADSKACDAVCHLDDD